MAHSHAVETNPPDIVVRLDGQFILLGEAEDSGSGGNIETVTVVVYPLNITSTLPQSHRSFLTEAASLSESTPLSFYPTDPTAVQAPSSSSPAPFESDSVPTTPVESNSESYLSSTEPVSSSSSRQFHPPSGALPVGPTSSSDARASPSKLANLDPPVYIGIALGGIAAFAIIVALVAWCIRWCSHRRRKAPATLPWAQPRDDDFNGLEAGGNNTADWGAGSRPTSSSEHSRPTTRHWISAARDAGQPRRSDGYGEVPGLLHGQQHRTPIHRQFFSDGVGREPIEDQYPPHTRKPHLRRQLPSHLVNENLSNQALAPGPDRVGGEYEIGTPREDVVVPRYLSLKGAGLELPWTRNHTNNSGPTPTPPRSMADRLRRASRTARESLERPVSPSDTPGRPAPGERGQKPDGWAESITTNLVNAFNAVAANIGTFHGDGERRDILTPKPSRRGTGRKPALDSPSDTTGGLSALDGYGNRSPKLSTESSVPWTLEELADGSGVVHLNISPSKEGAPPSRPARAPSSLYSSGSLSSIPLVASHEPQEALFKPEVSHYFRLQPETSVSRQTLYSQPSFVSSPGETTPPTARPLSDSKRRRNLNAGGKKVKVSPAPRRGPSFLSRLSSTSSATSWNTLSSPVANDLVAEALRKRTYSRG